MIKDFEGKVAVITGGAHGIGATLAKTCLELGMNVAITARRQFSVDEAVEKLDGGDHLLALRSDAGDAEATLELAGLVEARFGRTNLLCANAGISRINPIHDLTIESWREQLGVNLDGPFYAVKAFLPLLEKEEQAHIILTSSIFGLFAAGMQAPYFVSKAGLVALAESLFYDLRAANSSVGVTVACPGNTRTNMVDANVTSDDDPELVAAVRAEMAKGTDPQVVADALLDAVRTDRFYVLPNTGDFQKCVDARFSRIQAQRNPTLKDVGDAI